MIMGRGVSDAKTDGNNVEKSGIGERMAGGAQVVAGVEHQFVTADQ